MRALGENSELFFYILVRSWNCFAFFDQCIDSVLNQTYKNYKIIFVDDYSKYSIPQKNHIKAKLNGHITQFNSQRLFSTYNAYTLIHKYAKINEAVVVNLDGDDWFFGSDTLAYLAKLYQSSKCLLTYGECVFWDGYKYSKPCRLIKEHTNIPYPKTVIKDNSYRKYPFLPLHPLTWKVELFKRIAQQYLLRPDGTWLRFAQDQAIFYPMLEMAAKKCSVIKKTLYVYNVSNKHSDVRENFYQLLKDELVIRKKQPYEPLI